MVSTLSVIATETEVTHGPNCERNKMTKDEKMEKLNEMKLAIMSRLVYMTPHPRDENGQLVPIVSDKAGNLCEWPKDKNGNLVDVDELDAALANLTSNTGPKL